jgi:hypothetical protein
MEFKKLNKIDKLLLKWKDKDAYKNYKYLLSLQHKPIANTTVTDAANVHFKHSGNIGDIIYSLPALYELTRQGKAHLHLNVNQNMEHKHKYHPSGNVMLTDRAVKMLEPLLLHQEKIESCNTYTNQSIDFDLDLVRRQPLHFDKGNICRWYNYIFDVYPDLSAPWLSAPVNSDYLDKIIIARSHRYRAPNIDYSFLKKYTNLLFVGVEEEFRDMQKQIPNLQFQPVANFLELATIINSCKLFIGNQSFPFSLAEALKVNRILEMYYSCPNVNVCGKGGYDFYYQTQLESLIEKLSKS